ncbi:7861_t:CDS:2, partial [Entrophospora sp. SA101]
SLNQALDTLSRRGDPSALRAATALALMVRHESYNERLSRWKKCQ